MRKGVVSVVLPIYNVEKYLSRCLESVVNQSYRKLEIILVDDESPDKCPEICDKWAAKDSRIKVIHKKNGGLGYARNTGIESTFALLTVTIILHLILLKKHIKVELSQKRTSSIMDIILLTQMVKLHKCLNLKLIS